MFTSEVQFRSKRRGGTRAGAGRLSYIYADLDEESRAGSTILISSAVMIISNLMVLGGAQLQAMTLTYPTLPYPTMPYPTLPYPYPTLFCHTLPYIALPYPSLPYPTYSTLPYLNLQDFTPP